MFDYTLQVELVAVRLALPAGFLIENIPTDTPPKLGCELGNISLLSQNPIGDDLHSQSGGQLVSISLGFIRVGLDRAVGDLHTRLVRPATAALRELQWLRTSEDFEADIDRGLILVSSVFQKVVTTD